MQLIHFTTTCVIVGLALILADCGPAESVEIAVPHELCKCTNATAEIKCICISNKLTRIPDDLPTPLHEL